MQRFLYPIQANSRARDDLDMERIFRPRTNAPDIIRSALDHNNKKKKAGENKEKISSTTIDSLFGAPEKINIPERYIPDLVSAVT